MAFESCQFLLGEWQRFSFPQYHQHHSLLQGNVPIKEKRGEAEPKLSSIRSTNNMDRIWWGADPPEASAPNKCTYCTSATVAAA